MPTLEGSQFHNGLSLCYGLEMQNKIGRGGGVELNRAGPNILVVPSQRQQISQWVFPSNVIGNAMQEAGRLSCQTGLSIVGSQTTNLRAAMKQLVYCSRVVAGCLCITGGELQSNRSKETSGLDLWTTSFERRVLFSLCCGLGVQHNRRTEGTLRCGAFVLTCSVLH